MLNQFSRTELVLGKAAMARLAESRVAVIGLAAAGASCAEALARSAVGEIALFSDETVNRDMLGGSIFADEKTLGLSAADVAEARLLSINSEIKIKKHPLPRECDMPDFTGFDYIINATLSEDSAVLLAAQAQENGVPIISILDLGNAISAADAQYKISDVNKAKAASHLAFRLRKNGIKKHKIIYPLAEKGASLSSEFAGINACALGLIAAGEVIKDITGVRN